MSKSSLISSSDEYFIEDSINLAGEECKAFNGEKDGQFPVCAQSYLTGAEHIYTSNLKRYFQIFPEEKLSKKELLFRVPIRPFKHPDTTRKHYYQALRYLTEDTSFRITIVRI